MLTAVRPYPDKEARIMRQVIIRIARSATQLLTLALITFATPLLDWVGAVGVDVDTAAILIAVETVLFGLIVGGLSWAEERWPVISRILSWNLADNSGLGGYLPRHSGTGI
jgi:hypothetical protein